MARLLEADATGDISTASLLQREAPLAAASIPAGSAAAAPALARSRCCCCSGSRSIARLPSCCCCSPPRSCCCSAPIKPHFSRLNRLLGQSIFRGWGGLAGVKEEPPAAGMGGELFRSGEAALGPAVRRLKMNCRPSLNYMSSASLLPLRSVSTVAFRFHSKCQFRQLSSESTVFTSSVVVRWFLVMLILHPFYIIYWRCYSNPT